MSGGAGALGGSIRGFHGDGAGDAKRFAGAEGQEQAPGLEVGAEDRIDDAQAGDGRPAEIDASEVLGGDLGLVANPEPHAPETKHGPVPDQGDERPPWGLGHAQPQGSENGLQEGQSFVNLAADQELGRGKPFEVQRLGCRGPDGGFEIRRGGFRSLAAGSECVAELSAELPVLGGRAAILFQGTAIEPRGVIERECGGCLVAGPGVVPAGQRAVARSAKVVGKHLGVCVARAFQQPRQLLVVPPERLGFQMRENRLPDAIVINFDLVEPIRPGGADQPRRPQRARPARPCPARPSETPAIRESAVPRPRRSRAALGTLRLGQNPRPEHAVESIVRWASHPMGAADSTG